MPKLEGFKELNKKFKRLSVLDQGAVLRSAGNAAGQVVVKRARSLAPSGSVAHKTYKGRLVAPGFLKRSVAKKGSLSRDKSAMTVRIGVKSEAFYGLNFLELGTRYLPKRPWLTRAFNSTRTEQVNVMRKKMKAGIEKIARR